jgi:DNA-binding response OmpR family regulator
MHVLVLDDDDETRELVGRALDRGGHHAVPVATIPAAEVALRTRTFDVLVLDVMLEGGSGIELCVRLRARNVLTPILFLSARGTVRARIEGLEVGGDDYLSKPFAVGELVARVRALGRRGPSLRPRTIQAGAVTIDFDARRALMSGREVPITRREWDLLNVLGNARGRVVSFDEILERAWGDVSDGARASLEVLVSRLRRKLHDGEGRTLRTARGLGYALEDGR